MIDSFMIYNLVRYLSTYTLLGETQQKIPLTLEVNITVEIKQQNYEVLHEIICNNSCNLYLKIPYTYIIVEY